METLKTLIELFKEFFAVSNDLNDIVTLHESLELCDEDNAWIAGELAGFTCDCGQSVFATYKFCPACGETLTFEEEVSEVASAEFVPA